MPHPRSSRWTLQAVFAAIRSHLHSWPSRLHNQWRSDHVGEEINKEMRFHLEERVDDLIASGMPPEAARHEARRRFGNLVHQKELTRERTVFAWLDSVVADAWYAFRALHKAPVFALVAVLSLAVGIGANTAVFSVFNALLLKSLPVAHPEQLLQLKREGDNQFTNPLWEAVRDNQDVFDGVFAFSRYDFNLTSEGEARRFFGNFVSGDYFQTLGVHAVAGRTIIREDDVRGCRGIAVISNGFWQREYGGEPSAIGKTVSLDGNPFVIVGVLEASFFGVNVGSNPQVYAPLCAKDIISGPHTLDDRSSWFLQIIARPKAGLSPAQVLAGLASKARTIAESTVPQNFSAEGTERYRKGRFEIEPASQGLSNLRASYSKALYVLLTIASLVLLVACANVANLLLARATARQREIAVRLALGARRARIVRQLLTESLILSLAGGALGVAFAQWGGQLLISLISRSDQVTSLDLSIDERLLTFSIGVSLLTGVVFGIAPAWNATRARVHIALKNSGRSMADGQNRVSLAKVLVSAQVALSLVLLTAAGLLLGSWRNLDAIDPGFRKSSTLVVRADIRRAHIPADQRQNIVMRTLYELRNIPGVQHAAVSAFSYLDRESRNAVLLVDGFAPASSKDALSWVELVSDGYFTTLGVPLRRGRDFTASDNPTSPKVAIINETAARRFFRTGNVVGRTFRVEAGKRATEPYEIVGVVGDTRSRTLRDSAPPMVYFPRAQEEPAGQSARFNLHTDVPLAMASAVKGVLARNIPQATLDITTLDRQVNESMRLMRAIARLSGFFGGLALLLAALGLYGIMAYGVARRRNEIGVRVALGASQSRIVRMVLGDVGRIVTVGVVLGVALSFGVTRLVVSFLYDVKPNDPSTLGASALVLLIVGLTAAAIPAWKAARLNPVSALREE